MTPEGERRIFKVLCSIADALKEIQEDIHAMNNEGIIFIPKEDN